MAVKVEPIGLREIQYRLAAFEEKFDMPTETFVEAFRNGELRETSEFREWAMLQAAWDVATRRSR